MNNKGFYEKLIRNFATHGISPNALLYADDALTMYLCELMADESVRCHVMADEVAARVFVDSMMQFVHLYQQKANYQKQRCSFEEKQIAEARLWSIDKRKESWQALLDDLNGRYGSQGFNALFYAHELRVSQNVGNEALWLSMLNDWQYHLNLALEQRNKAFLESRKSLQSLLLRNNLKSAPAYVRQHNVSKERFFQSWALMGGRWNETAYKRLQAIVDLQLKYPVLTMVANRLGRVADVLGSRQIGYTSGRNEQMEHASHSDITGISLGADLSSMLPLELAQFSDADMENLFIKKYISHHLQVFGYQSNSLNAARSLQQKKARPGGPIIVCVDTSGSMDGLPMQIALSLMMKLAEMCEKAQRSCLLIPFSVQAEAIDVLHDRVQLLRFFEKKAAGDTDSKKMLDKVFLTLTSSARYGGADVLWITDFRIPLPNARYLCAINDLRKHETCFYGLQIGIAQNHWTPYFDDLFQITETP